MWGESTGTLTPWEHGPHLVPTATTSFFLRGDMSLHAQVSTHGQAGPQDTWEGGVVPLSRTPAQCIPMDGAVSGAGHSFSWDVGAQWDGQSVSSRAP